VRAKKMELDAFGGRGGTPRELFESSLQTIREITASVAFRRRMFNEDAEDFCSFVFVRLIDRDYAVLAKFQGRSSIRTYLTVVIERLAIDYRISQCGKWRPSRRAVELGPEAIRLDKLVHRDGYTVHEAVQTLAVSNSTELSEEALAALALELPARQKRSFQEAGRSAMISRETDCADRPLLENDRAVETKRLQAILRRAFGHLSSENRVIARLRFIESWPPARISKQLGLPTNSVYRRIDRLKQQLRSLLQAEGISGPVHLSDD
jgi:RNA polymerase sigma factor for flagellar operon FliA